MSIHYLVELFLLPFSYSFYRDYHLSLSIAAFVTAMERFGFEGVDAFDIVNTGKEVREELAKTDPEAAAGL